MPCGGAGPEGDARRGSYDEASAPPRVRARSGRSGENRAVTSPGGGIRRALLRTALRRANMLLEHDRLAEAEVALSDADRARAAILTHLQHARRNLFGF